MDYYEVLGIHKNASKIEIRKAYHKLAIIWHPDKNNSSDAKIKFQKISEAYQVLYNEKSRSEYDLSGRTDFKMKSPEDLFNELFINVDPVISRFLKNYLPFCFMCDFMIFLLFFNFDYFLFTKKIL